MSSRPSPAASPAGRGGRVARGQHRLDLPRFQRPGQPGQRVPGRRRHGGGQRDGDDAVDVQEAEQGAQRGHDPLGRPWLLPGLIQHECPYLGGSQLLQVQAPVPVERPLLQERAGQADVQRDRSLRQAPLGGQVARVPVQHLPGLRHRARRRGRDCPQPAQVAQQRPERRDGPLVDIPCRPAGFEVPFRHQYFESLRVEALCAHPAAQVGHQPELARGGERGIPKPGQPGPEPLRVLRERPGHVRPGRFRLCHHELLFQTISVSGKGESAPDLTGSWRPAHCSAAIMPTGWHCRPSPKHTHST